MGKLRCSYSLLNAWSTGHQQEAISNYLHLEQEKTPQQIHGLDVHKAWQDEIMKNKKMTFGKSKFTFKNPIVEKEIIKDYNDRWLVKGYVDCIDNDLIYEFKTGVTSSAQYSNTFQIPFYFMLCELAGITISRAVIIREDNDQTVDISYVWNHKEMVEDTRNWVESITPEVENYMVTNNIKI